MQITLDSPSVLALYHLPGEVSEYLGPWHPDKDTPGRATLDIYTHVCLNATFENDWVSLKLEPLVLKE